MKQIDYKNITIGQVQCLNKSGYYNIVNNSYKNNKIKNDRI